MGVIAVTSVIVDISVIADVLYGVLIGIAAALGLPLLSASPPRWEFFSPLVLPPVPAVEPGPGGSRECFRRR